MVRAVTAAFDDCHLRSAAGPELVPELAVVGLEIGAVWAVRPEPAPAPVAAVVGAGAPGGEGVVAGPAVVGAGNPCFRRSRRARMRLICSSMAGRMPLVRTLPGPCRKPPGPGSRAPLQHRGDVGDASLQVVHRSRGPASASRATAGCTKCLVRHGQVPDAAESTVRFAIGLDPGQRPHWRRTRCTAASRSSVASSVAGLRLGSWRKWRLRRAARLFGRCRGLRG
jgi:hypothetical protein